MEIWDEKMQMECAKSFEKHDVVKLMTTPNQTKLMEECLNYILNADITHEEVTTLHIYNKFQSSSENG